MLTTYGSGFLRNVMVENMFVELYCSSSENLAIPLGNAQK